MSVAGNTTEVLEMKTAQQLIDFWFSDATRPMWFNSTSAFDAELHDTYFETYQTALKGELDHWANSAGGALALVICLDQLPLNMLRGQAGSFAGEAASRRVAAAAIEQGFDQGLGNAQKAFMYIPYMHSETLADQDRALQLFEQAGLHDNLHWARHHRSIVERFGRFPHRNEILGRQSTAEELAWLASDEAFSG
jgi:uncharacterized protein (DUF924 family)